MDRITGLLRWGRREEAEARSGAAAPGGALGSESSEAARRRFGSLDQKRWIQLMHRVSEGINRSSCGTSSHVAQLCRLGPSLNLS